MPFRRLLCLFVSIAFAFTLIMPPPSASAQTILDLPAPGSMVYISPNFQPALIKGLTVHRDNPFLFDFIVDPGQSKLSAQAIKDESDRMIRYFFASLTIPDRDIWVNLSPYEKDRMIPESLGVTAMGRDLLAQDYMLKQLTASLIYPQKALGKTFWDMVYSKAKEMYGTTQIPVNTFNKVWIVPQQADIYEHGQTAFIVDGHLKVMLEEDYLSLTKHNAISTTNVINKNDTHAIGSQVIRQIILPEIEREVNNDENFATLRQIFYAQVLAVWFKRNLKQALLNQVYANKGTVKGIDQNDVATNEAIYHQYLQAYKKGVFNYIQEDRDPVTQEALPRKYFSGGYDALGLNGRGVTLNYTGNRPGAAMTANLYVAMTAIASSPAMAAKVNRWVKVFGTAIAVGVPVGIGIPLAYNAWNSHKINSEVNTEVPTTVVLNGKIQKVGKGDFIEEIPGQYSSNMRTVILKFPKGSKGQKFEINLGTPSGKSASITQVVSSTGPYRFPLSRFFPIPGNKVSNVEFKTKADEIDVDLSVEINPSRAMITRGKVIDAFAQAMDFQGDESRNWIISSFAALQATPDEVAKGFRIIQSEFPGIEFAPEEMNDMNVSASNVADLVESRVSAAMMTPKYENKPFNEAVGILVRTVLPADKIIYQGRDYAGGNKILVTRKMKENEKGSFNITVEDNHGPKVYLVDDVQTVGMRAAPSREMPWKWIGGGGAALATISAVLLLFFHGPSASTAGDSIDLAKGDIGKPKKGNGFTVNIFPVNISSFMTIKVGIPDPSDPTSKKKAKSAAGEKVQVIVSTTDDLVNHTLKGTYQPNGSPFTVGPDGIVQFDLHQNDDNFQVDIESPDGKSLIFLGGSYRSVGSRAKQSTSTENPNYGKALNGNSNSKNPAMGALPFGGIDLSREDAAMRISRDPNGGVVVDVDPALVARAESQGMSEVIPVIVSMQREDANSIFGPG